MMKLLLVNPNMTQAVTDRVVAEARRCARPGTDMQGVTATFGVAIVSTEAEVAIAAHAALDLLATHHAGHDAAIIAMSFDAGALAARRLLPIPVLGITEAAIHTACLLGRRFGMIVPAPSACRCISICWMPAGCALGWPRWRWSRSGRSQPISTPPHWKPDCWKQRSAWPNARRSRPSCSAARPLRASPTACSRMAADAADRRRRRGDGDRRNCW